MSPNKAIGTIYNLAIADIESCVIEFLSPLYDLKQYFKLLAFYRTLFPNSVNSIVFVVLLGSVPFVFIVRDDIRSWCLIGQIVEGSSNFCATLTQLHGTDIHAIVHLMNSF